MDLLITTVVTITFVAIGLVVGRGRERRHHEDLERREALLHGTFVVSQVKVLPDWAVHGELVTGSAVIASDYFKSFAAKLRGIVGGELRSFQTLMARARREALLRCVDDARSHGAVGIGNVRFETSNISSGAGRSGMVAVEILCFATSLIPARPVGASEAPAYSGSWK